MSEPTTDGRPTKIVWLLPLAGVLWLAFELWAARGQIKTSDGGTVTLATAAYALPGVVEATLVAGIGLALTAVSVLRSPATWLRWVAAGLGGAIAGGVAAGLVGAAYPHLPSISSIAAMLVVTGLLGGILTALPRIGWTVPAGLAAMLAALVVSTILNSNRVLSRMLDWFGAGTTPESYVHASKLVQFTDYAVIGLVAGIVAYAYLRRRGVRVAPVYVLAGALPGILLMVAFGLTEIGGHHLLDAANHLSEADRIINGMESSETLPNDLLVLFAGALASMIAYGRTLKPATGGQPKKTTTSDRDTVPRRRENQVKS